MLYTSASSTSNRGRVKKIKTALSDNCVYRDESRPRCARDMPQKSACAKHEERDLTQGPPCDPSRPVLYRTHLPTRTPCICIRCMTACQLQILAVSKVSPHPIPIQTRVLYLPPARGSQVSAAVSSSVWVECKPVSQKTICRYQDEYIKSN